MMRLFVTAANIREVPESPGVFFLYRGGRLIYVGVADAATPLRHCLEAHRRGGHGHCTQAATEFQFEALAEPAAVAGEFLLGFAAEHGGRLPECNGGGALPAGSLRS